MSVQKCLLRDEIVQCVLGLRIQGNAFFPCLSFFIHIPKKIVICFTVDLTQGGIRQEFDQQPRKSVLVWDLQPPEITSCLGL